MAWSKRQIVEKLYGELALAGYDFDLSPQEMQFALTTLDAMLAMWDSQGVQVGYAFGLTPDDTDLDQDSGLPLHAVAAVYLNGAMWVAASKGKQLGNTTKAAAKMSYDALLSRCAREQMQRQQLPSTMLRGAGNRQRSSSPFFPTTDAGPLGIDGAGNLGFLGN